MQYGNLVGLDSSTTIKNYKKENNMIIIEYLDGTINEILLTEKNEEIILKQMVIQAQEYVRRMNETKEIRNSVFLFTAASLVATTASVASFLCSSSFIETKATALTLSSISSTCFGLNLSANNRVLQDMKKYSIYLRSKQLIHQYRNNPDLLNGIKESDIDNININNLDNYTLKDMKILKSNIKRIRFKSSISNKEKDIKTLQKKY